MWTSIYGVKGPGVDLFFNKLLFGISFGFDAMSDDFASKVFEIQISLNFVIMIHGVVDFCGLQFAVQKDRRLIYDSITSFWTFFWASTLCVIIPSPKF
jgi:hypothetical protein